MGITIKSIYFDMEVKLNGPEQYESRTLKFGAWASLNNVERGDVAEVCADGSFTLRDGTVVTADGEVVSTEMVPTNLGEAREAARDLCGFVKDTLQAEAKAYLDYRQRLRVAHYREVYESLPQHLRAYLDPKALLAENDPTVEGSNGHNKGEE